MHYSKCSLTEKFEFEVVCLQEMGLNETLSSLGKYTWYYLGAQWPRSAHLELNSYSTLPIAYLLLLQIALS